MFYILKRNEELQIIKVSSGSDPLYGYGSWNLHDGPFDSWKEAEDSIPQELLDAQIDAMET